MPALVDGHASPLFSPVTLRGNRGLSSLSAGNGLSDALSQSSDHALSGRCVVWGLPFQIGRVVVIQDKPVTVKLPPTRAPWLVFMHTSDIRPDQTNEHGFISPTRGIGKLAEHAADYVMLYADGSERRVAIRRRHQIGAFRRTWGENCTECVPHVTPQPMGDYFEQPGPVSWGRRQGRTEYADGGPWINWLWAFENPYPKKALTGIRFEPVSGALIVSALTAGRTSSYPLRWEKRQKGILALPKNTKFDPTLDSKGLLKQVQLDMGRVISARPRLEYPNRSWARTRLNLQPERIANEVVVEYTAHPDARFYLAGGRSYPAAKLRGKSAGKKAPLRAIAPATQRVTLRAVVKKSRKPVPVKLHVHGAAGEYLPPTDHHRIPNPSWFEDYGAEFCHGLHTCAYIPGETVIDLPLGNVYIEVTKGFEIKPVRKVVKVTRATTEIVIELEKVLPWRERGWVTGDTHVHFLSPPTAMLEGAAEGVNVINLLASQWGELMTNAGDFDGKTTFGSKEAGGDGEYLVRVGTENRQHVLGHISLLGYDGSMITPMCSGGPSEAAIGDPVDVLMTEWARQCKQQGGLVIMPHFPNPRLENAACLVLGEIDGVEQCSWGNHYAGINPYSLSDWYRYLNNGYLTAAVGGTDKMSAGTAVGTIRTYARVDPRRGFTHDSWMDAVRRAETFCTYGPLLEFEVEGRPLGSRIKLPASGGTVSVSWKLASVTIPMTRVELVVNGEIREGRRVKPNADRGQWTVKVDKSTWLALLVRAKYADKPEMIAAHSSPVMLDVKGSPFFAAADSVTILEQIEGALAYIDTAGTRAETKRYKQMRLVLESAHRKLHNRLHEMGHYHEHTPATHHAEHRH